MKMLLESANFEFHFNNREKARVLSPSKQSILAMILREAVLSIQKRRKYIVVSRRSKRRLL